MEILEQFYLAALSRKPTEQEIQHWTKQLDSADKEEQFLEDFVWGLTTCAEFVSN